MLKIGNKLLLGAVSGLIGNIPKILVCDYFKKNNWVEVSCPERSAKLVIRPEEVKSSKGMLVGYITDCMVAGLLGIAYTYGLSIAGKKNAVLKGALAGPPSWIFLSALYVLTGNKDARLSPGTVLCKFLLAAIHGSVTCYTAGKFGKPELFSDN